MPQKISMILSNNHTYRPEIKTREFQPNLAPNPVSKGVGDSIHGSMIGRIHTIKPGCGSCGR